MLLWPGDDEKSCCSPGAVQRARTSAAELGVPFYTDRRAAQLRACRCRRFRRHLRHRRNAESVCRMQPSAPRTAGRVRRPDRSDTGATGHYARIVWRDDEPFLGSWHRSREGSSRTCSGRSRRRLLARLQFPLAGLTKPDVRRARCASQATCRRRGGESGSLLRSPGLSRAACDTWSHECRRPHRDDVGRCDR